MPQYLDLAELKARLHVDFADDDAELTGYLDAAESYIGDPKYGILGRPVLQETFTEWFGDFGVIEIANPDDVYAATIEYVDVSGGAQTFPSDQYTVRDGTFRLVNGATWPDHIGEVSVTYQSGWLAGEIPAAIKNAGYLFAAFHYDPQDGQKESELTNKMNHTLAGFRRIKI